jgi:hypothetical protein
MPFAARISRMGGANARTAVNDMFPLENFFISEK